MVEHIPVLLHEAIDGLAILQGDTFLDATLGSGGHSRYVFEKFSGKVKIIGFDQDEEALRRGTLKLSEVGYNITTKEGNFRNLDKLLDELGVEKVERILFDLGTSAYQIEESGRGFSFRRNEPLRMTMPTNSSEAKLTARDIVNDWEGENIALILKAYGDESFAKRIVSAILSARTIKPIETTGELTKIISEAVPAFYKRKKIHPATKTFQALRIAVNDEIRALSEGIEKGFARLSTKGRMAVISFHSTEDRIVKNFYKAKAGEGIAKIITKRPITPTEEETISNPRSRSAKLRIIEKI